MILLYQMDGHPLLPAIRLSAGLFGEELKIVPPEEEGKPIGSLVFKENGTLPGGARSVFPSPVTGDLPTSFPKAAAPTKASAVPEPMMVLCGMDPERLSSFIDQLKTLSQGASASVLKAVLTPTNSQWSAAYLCEHLKEERAYYQNRRGGKA